jgi:hypothetical protein
MLEPVTDEDTNQVTLDLVASSLPRVPAKEHHAPANPSTATGAVKKVRRSDPETTAAKENRQIQPGLRCSERTNGPSATAPAPPTGRPEMSPEYLRMMYRRALKNLYPGDTDVERRGYPTRVELKAHALLCISLRYAI